MENVKHPPEKHKFKIVYEYTEPNGIEYAHEKLGVAVWKLATGIGVIKERLADAFIEIAILQETDFPTELCEQWKQIHHDLTRGKPQFKTQVKDGQLLQIPIGRLYSTLRYMRKDKAQRIAQQICDLHAKLNDYIENKNNS